MTTSLEAKDKKAEVGLVDMKHEPWWIELVSDCRAIVVERGFNSRFETILGKWELGERVATDDNFNKHGKGNQAVVAGIAADVGCSASDLYHCVQFYEQYPKGVKSALDGLGEGKNVSWYRIVQQHLGERSTKRLGMRTTYGIGEILEAFGEWHSRERLGKDKLLEHTEGFRKVLEKPKK